MLLLLSLVAASAASYGWGAQRGRAAGSEEAYASGFAQGQSDGQSKGYTLGVTAGKSKGYSEGFDRGMHQGRALGEALGKSQGATAACWFLFRKLNTDRIYNRPPGYVGPSHYYNSSVCRSIGHWDLGQG